jgi:methionyl-tRNA formyltransferase
MKTVFFGSPEAAIPSLEALLAAGHAIELVVTQPDKPAGRGRRLAPSAVKSFAAARGIPVLAPLRIRSDESARDRILAVGADVHIVVAYGQIIPNAVHYPPPHHSLNVHFSLLPKYRGAAPVQWTVLNGDAQTGVTIIELNDRMDEGDILAQERVAVGPRETARALEERLAVLGARLLISTLARLDEITRLPQDGSRATLAPKIRKEDGRISWTDPAAVVDRKVLALADRPGVFTYFQGRRLNILRGRPAGPDEGPVAASLGDPGMVVAVGKSGLTVSCAAATAYLVEQLQPEGKGVMSAHAFTLGARIAPGDRFET